MVVTKISDALQFEGGQQVMAISGIVDSIYEWNEGDNDHGHWSIQNLFIKDGSSKIKVKIKDRPALALKLKGKKIYLACTNRHNKGWTGIKIKDDEYPKGKWNKIVYVTPSAEISLPDSNEIISEGGDDNEDGGSHQQPPPQNQRQPQGQTRQNQQPRQQTRQEPPPQNQRQPQGNPPAPADTDARYQEPPQSPPQTTRTNQRPPANQKPPLVSREEQAAYDAEQRGPGENQESEPEQQQLTPEEIEAQRVADLAMRKAEKEKANQIAVNDLRSGLRKYCNAYWLCIQATEHIADKYEHEYGEGITADHYQAMIATLWIQANRDGLVSDMPTGDMTKYLPAPKQPPANTQPVLPVDPNKSAAQ